MQNRLDSELAILGAAFLKPEVIGELVGQLDVEDFLHPAHRAVWAAMLELWLSEQPLEPEIIAARVRASRGGEALDLLGGADFITLLPNQCIVFETTGYHVKRVRLSAQRYRWGQVLAKLAARAKESDETDEEYLEAVGSDLLKMMLVEGGKSKNTKREKGRKQVLKEVIAALEFAHENRSKQMIGVPTGIAALDAHSKGLRPGQLIILAARPGVGKSALMSQIVDYAAAAKIPVLVFSLEMTALELGKRSVSAESGVDAQRMSTGDLQTQHWAAITRAASRLSDHDVTVVDVGSCNLVELRSIAKRWRMAHPDGDGLIAVDYLQLVKATTKDSNREQQVAEVSITLKQIAKDLEVPVLALAQLNRKVEDRTNKRPGLADLRESGQIEQDADIVMFLHREEIFSKKEEDKGKAELIVAKARSMPTFTADLLWQAHLTRFVNPTERRA
jgi:replicative DNA helicase